MRRPLPLPPPPRVPATGGQVVVGRRAVIGCPGRLAAWPDPQCRWVEWEEHLWWMPPLARGGHQVVGCGPRWGRQAVGQG